MSLKIIDIPAMLIQVDCANLSNLSNYVLWVFTILTILGIDLNLTISPIMLIAMILRNAREWKRLSWY